MRFVFSIITGLFLTSTAAYADEFILASNAVEAGHMVPKVNTCDKGNHTPELHWSGAPAKTQSYALMGVGYDSPMGKIYGWVVYNIPANVNGFAANIQNLPPGTQVGRNGLGDSAYRGPCPPDAHMHRYGFELYALDTNNISVNGDDTGPAIMDAIKSHILKEATLKVVYRH